MEVDTHSSSLAAFPCNAKRAHSPDFSGPTNRALKRLVVSLPSSSLLGPSSLGARVDWVKQTGELSIRGKNPSTRCAPYPAGTTDDSVYETMTMDQETSETNSEPCERETSPRNLSLFDAATSRLGSASRYPSRRPPYPLELYDPHETPLLAAASNTTQSNVLLIASCEPQHAHTPPPELEQPSDPSPVTTRPSSSTGVSHSASWAPTAAPSPTTPRRTRVTLGPRVDCEKCRMGVKGHWMHL